MKSRFIVLLAFVCVMVHAQDRAPVPKLWYFSVSQMVAGASFDAWSSHRMNSLADVRLARETNGLYTDDGGRYVASKALPIECGVYIGTAAAEYLLMRKHPKLARAFSVLNFGLSGIGFSSGVRNITLYNRLTRQ